MRTDAPRDRSIEDDVWHKHFAAASGRYDGERFEELSLEVLRGLIGGDWRRTRRSFDGNKDFVLEFASGSYWAESKAYAQKLTYHVISPTLFMALIGDPEVVVIVSRSTIHSRSKKYLAQFQRKTGKRIVAIDGDTLDRAIIAHPEVTDRFFPGEVLTAIPRNRIVVETSVTPDLTTRPTKAFWESDPAPLHVPPLQGATIGVGELLRADVAVVNESLEPVVDALATLEWPEGVSDAHFDVLGFCEETQSSSVTFSLGPAEIRHLTVFVRGLKPGRDVALPQLRLISARTGSLSDLGRATITQLYRIGLVGKANHALIARCRADAHTRRNAWVQVVEGGSGSGKSRILRELAGEFAAAGYLVHAIDKEFYEPQKSGDLLRGLLAQINNIPVVEDMHATVRSTDDDVDVVTRLIFHASRADQENPDLVADAFMRSLSDRKSALLIDNVQNFDDIAAVALSALVDRVRLGSSPNIAIVLAFNTDLCVEMSEADALRRRLAGLSEQSAAARVRCAQLTGLTDVEADEFLFRAVAAGDDRALSVTSYPLTLAAFREHVPRNPLHMWETLRWLRDIEALELRNELLIVADKDDATIASLLSTIPPDLNALMSRRWEEIQAAAERSHAAGRRRTSAASLAKGVLAACFAAPASPATFHALGVSARTLSRLVDLGVLVEGSQNELRFVHERIFYFFQRCLRPLRRDVARRLLRGMAAISVAESRFEPFFILSVAAGVNDNELRRRTSRLFLERGSSREYFEEFLELLVNDLLHPATPLNDETLRTFMKGCDVMQSMKSMRAGFTLINRAFYEKVVTADASASSGGARFEFARHNINATLAVAEDGLARSLIENALAGIDTGGFATSREAELARAALIDRKASLLKSYGSFDEAVALGESALAIARSQNDAWLEIELLSNLAEVHYRRNAPDSLTCGDDNLEQAVECFEKAPNRWDMADPVPTRSFVNRCRLALRGGDWKTLTHDAERGLQFAESTRNRFWSARLALLGAAGWLVAQNCGEAERRATLRAIARAQDVMNVYGARRDLWAVSYLRAKAALLTGDVGRADECFRQSISTLKARDRTGQLIFQRLDLAVDIAMDARIHGLPLRRDLPELVNNPYVAEECRVVGGMTDVAFHAYRAARERTAYCVSRAHADAPALTLIAL